MHVDCKLTDIAAPLMRYQVQTQTLLPCRVIVI